MDEWVAALRKASGTSMIDPCLAPTGENFLRASGSILRGADEVEPSPPRSPNLSSSSRQSQNEAQAKEDLEQKLLLNTIIAVQKEQNRKLEKRMRKMTNAHQTDMRRLTQELEAMKKSKADLEKYVKNLTQQLDTPRLDLMRENANLHEEGKRKDLQIKILQADQKILSQKLAQCESTRCCVCYDQVADSVIVPCGHNIMCTDCIEKLNHCPICNAAIESRLRVYKG